MIGNNIIKKYIFGFRSGIFFLFIFIIFPFIKVKANTINDISIDVYIDKSGNAKITEIWDADLTQGTEGYRPFTGLENSSISNFKVKDDEGNIYTPLEQWDTNAKFYDKAYKSGFNYISDGVELCWGISKYGHRVYTLEYEISNLVVKYTDKQGIYFNFLNLDIPVKSAEISLYSDTPLSLNNVKIWGFGYKGNDTFQNGKIVMKTDKGLSSSDYMTLLVRFENDMFDVNNISYRSFDEVYDEAFSNVKEKEVKKTPIREILSIILMFLLSPTLFYIVAVILILSIYKSSVSKTSLSSMTNSDKVTNKLILRPEDKLPDFKDINYYRDIPCDKNIFLAYWISDSYSITGLSTLKKGIIGAILLKWIKEKRITIEEQQSRFMSKNNYIVDFTKMEAPHDEMESRLYNIFIEAAGENSILEPFEFEKWSAHNYQKLENWFIEVDNFVSDNLTIRGLILDGGTTEDKYDGKVNIKHMALELKNEAINIQGFKKFILDFSIIPEREYIEVHIWEDYLIFAELLGLADKVREQFKKIYPDFKDYTSIMLRDTSVYAAHVIAEYCYNSIERNKTYREHNYSGTSRSSGGGGRSYSGGGSSSKGSSGGGFR